MFGAGESFKDFYLKQSNGRFLAKGDVSDWVTVPYNEARYGHDHDDDVRRHERGRRLLALRQGHRHRLVQRAEGRGQDATREIKTYLAQFDRVDRYDFDGDGNFNEPDGYIDHFQAIHAGEGEEAGGGAQGADAIWSHRWYAYSTDAGTTGPAFNQARWRASSATPACGSVTTRPSPRTAASASSRTSSATTSVCPTSTTPRVATTAPPSGR